MVTHPLSPQDLKAQIDLRALVQSFLGSPIRSTPSYDLYRSPWRDDHQHASFVVYQQRYKDYGGSGESGDAIDFIMRTLKLSFPEAKTWLSNRQDTPFSSAGRSTANGPQAAPNEPPTAAWQQAVRQALEQAVDSLWSGAPEALAVLDYLRQQRGLTDATIRAYRLGYNPRGYHLRVVNPLTGRTERVWLPPGLLIPIEGSGAQWAVKVRSRVGDFARALKRQPDQYAGHRRPSTEVDKYLSVQGSKPRGAFFNGDHLTPGGDIVLVEGEFDAMLAQQVLGERVRVVTLGSAAHLPNRRQLDQLKAARRVYLLFDADRAGQGTAEAVADLLGDQAQQLTLPQGKDVTEFVVDHQGDLIRWFQAASEKVKADEAGGARPELALWPQGIPDGLRAAVLKTLPDAYVLVLELINRALMQGLLDAKGITIKALSEARERLGFHLSENTLRNVLNGLEGELFQRLETQEESDLVSKTCEKSGRGRPQVTWELLPVAQFQARVAERLTYRLVEHHYPADGEQAVLASFDPELLAYLDSTLSATEVDSIGNFLGMLQERQGDVATQAAQRLKRELELWRRALNDPQSTLLTVDWLQTASTYRAGLLRAKVLAAPDDSRSIADLTRLLGAAPSSLKVIRQRAGVENIAQSARLTVETTNPQQIRRAVQQFGRTNRGYPQAIEICDEQGTLLERRAFKSAEPMDQFLASQVRCGRQVSIRFQLANKQRLLEVLPPVKLPPAPRTPAPQSDRTSTGSAPRPPTDTDTFVRPRRPRRQQRYVGSGHDPRWLQKQLLLAFQCLGWVCRDQHWLDPETGETLPEHFTFADCIRCLLQWAQSPQSRS